MRLDWRNVEFEGAEIGVLADLGESILFFGNKDASKEVLPRAFAGLTFQHLKQVHGRSWVIAPQADIVEADAQATQNRGLALVIQTADCLPVLGVMGSKIFAAHVGWRGVALNIVAETLRGLAESGAPSSWDVSRAVFAVGPHIAAKDFQVGRDALVPLQASWYDSTIREGAAPWSMETDGRARVDLARIVKGQIQKTLGHSNFTFDVRPESTLTSPHHFSHRRQPGAGRQYSFVALKPDAG